MGFSAESNLKAYLNSSICTFTYYPQEKRIVLSERTCLRYRTQSEYTNMPDSFAQLCVQENDWPVFKSMYQAIDEGKESARADFHSLFFNLTLRVTLTTVAYSEDGKPLEALGIIEDGTELFRSEMLGKEIQDRFLPPQTQSDEDEKEALSLIASTIGGLYYALYHIWLKTGTYLCYSEKLPGVLSLIGERGSYLPAWEKYISDYIEPEDQEKMTEFADFFTLAERLKDTNQISMVYRRKGVGWTRGQFFCAKRDDEGNAVNLIYAVTDINAEMLREKRSLKAVYDAHHDPLTNVLNRSGFESVVEAQPEEESCAFALFDIDHFKNLNDTYGHEAGDRVLQRVAECLTDTFRSEDSVFRYGGDEFGVLLRDCTADAWTVICKKQENIHNLLAKSFPEMGTITLSVGLTFAPHKYTNDMILLADEGLYETKRNGRAGCTWVNSDHSVEKRWRDDKLSLHTEVALERTATGVFRMDIPKDNFSQPRMLCNDTTKHILGIADSATPEECYRLWAQGIEKSYIDAIYETKHKMVSGRQAEVTYLWKHPDYGYIYIRSGGYGEETEDTEILHGYVHGLKDTSIVTRKDDSQKIAAALNGMFMSSYYLDFKDNTYIAIKEPDSSKEIRKGTNTLDPNVSFMKYLVCEEDLEEMKRFCNIETLRTRLRGHKNIECPFRRSFDHMWCLASYLPVNYDARGELTNALFVISQMDENRIRDLQESRTNKRSLQGLFDHVPGGIILYEWDGKQLKTLKISRYYVEQYGDTMVSESEGYVGGPDYSRVHPDDVLAYKAAIVHALKVTHKLEYVYRVWNHPQNRYVWVKLNAVSEPQADGTSLVYAMYSDVTEQMDAQNK